VVRTERRGPSLRLPILGEVTLPPPEHSAWYVAMGALTVLELVDWPIAALVTAGKALADNRHNQTLQNVGEALEDAG
jgi:hypothetical protein